MNPLLILLIGAIASAVSGLIGIALTKRENAPLLDILSEDELRSYRTNRLMREGIAFCTIGRHDFRPPPNGSTNACEICLPPVRESGKWEPHYQPERDHRSLNFGKSYRPLYMDYPDIFRGDDK